MGDKEEPIDDFELPSQMLFSQMQRYFDNQYQSEVEQRVKRAEDEEMAYVKTPPHNDNETTEDNNNIFNEIIEDEDTTDGTDQPDQTSILKPREDPPLFLVNNTPIDHLENNINTVEQSSGSGHLYQSPVTTQQLMHDINVNTIDNLSPIMAKDPNISNNNNRNNSGVESDAEMDEIMAFIENNKVEAKVINAPEIDLDLDPDQFVELMKDKLADVPLDQVQIQLEEILSQKSNSTPPVNNNVHSTTNLADKLEEKNSQKETKTLPVIITSTPPTMKTPSQSDISNSTNDKTLTPEPPLSTTPIVQKMENSFVQSQIPVPENNIVLPYKLNDEQLKAVQSPLNIPLMIAAGPGSGTLKIVYHTMTDLPKKGKTLTLVCRIVHMLSNNIPSNSIVAITFTRKAANEMRDRIERVSKSLNIQTTLGLTICTFHQFCLKILRLHSHLLTSDLKKFEVYTRRKQEDVLLRCFTEWNNRSNSPSQTSQNSQEQQPFDFKIPDGGDEHKKLIRSCFTLIRKIKANPCNPEKIANPFFRFIYLKYNEIMNTAGGIDFNDFISKTVELFSKHPEVLHKYQKIYQQVLVDEFQDISSMQWELLKLLTSESGQITAVGDVDQSIYSFRGATVKNFEQFNNQFPKKILIRLNQNYRSTKNILQCASELIKNNIERPNATAMYTNNEQGKRLVLVLSKTPRDEIINIMDMVQQKKDNEGFKLRDIAILYRNRYIGKAFEPELRRRKLNFGLNGKVSFYHYSEVLDILAYLRLIIDENDDAAFKRIFNVPTRGLGTKTLKTVEKTATMRNISLFKAAKKVLEYNADVKNQQQRGLKLLIGLLDKIRTSTDFEKKSLSDIIKLVIERTKYQNYLWKLADDRNRNKENGLTDEEDALDGIDEEHLTDDFDDEEMPQEKSSMEPVEMKNISRLIQESHIFVQEYYKWKTSYRGQQQHEDSENNDLLDESFDGTKPPEKTETFKMLKLFLTQVSYDVKETDEKDQLTLSTIHQSKGLEWPIVILVHVNEGYLPSKHFGEKIAMNTSQEGVSKSIGEDEYAMIEEERRLCYVAMTRAEQQLIISTFAEENGMKSLSSRFLEEIPKEQCCELINKIPKEKSPVQIKQKNSTINVKNSNANNVNNTEISVKSTSFQVKKIEVDQSQLPPMLRAQNVSPTKLANSVNAFTPTKVSPPKQKSPSSPMSHLPSRQKKVKRTDSAKKKIDFSRHNEFTSAREVSEDSSEITDNYFESEDKDPGEIKDEDENDEENTEKQTESGPTVDDLAALIDSEDSASSAATLQQSSKKSQSPVKEAPVPGLSKLMDSRVRSPGLRRTNKRRHSTGTAAEAQKPEEFESPLKKQKTSLGHSTNVNKK